TSLSALYNDIDETDLATHTLQGNLWPNSIDLKIVPRIPMPRPYRNNRFAEYSARTLQGLSSDTYPTG
ncbi:hypothetical protein Moror_13464, partial [Moniliophthora roreri MCA 2997]